MAGESLIIGNGNWGVKSGNLLGYNLNNAKYVPRELTFTRATTGTRTNGALLVEEVPYNLLQYSEQFENAAWSKTNSSIISNQAIAPNGALIADRFVEDTTNGLHIVNQSTVAAGGFYNASVYVKPNGRNWIYISMAAASNYAAYFDIQNGVVGTVESNIISASITSAGGGWYRCVLTANTSALSPRANIYTTISNGVSSYTGDGVSGIYIWGAQLVAGSSPLDYLPTTTRLNIPRIDYSTGTAALLMEPQRTNIALRSEEFDNASWSKINSSVTANTIASPSGIVNADTLIDNSVNDIHALSLINIGGAGTYTMSFFAKANTLTRVGVFTNSAVNVNLASIPQVFDLLNGTVVNTISGVTASIQSYGNGWYRCQLVIPSGASGNYLITCISSGITASYIGSGSSLYLWGGQVEAGAYPTSYIPTTSASVTRNIDTLIQSGISNFIGQTQGTIFFDVRINESDSSSSVRLLGGISDGTSSNRIEIYRFNNTIQTDGVVGGAVQFSASVFTITNFNTNLKIAISYNLNNVNTFVNGVLVSTDTTALIPACSRLSVGCDRNGSSSYGGLINQMSLFPNPLSNAELAILTTK